jgi:hypothetical protein
VAVGHSNALALAHLRIGKEDYILSAGGLLMPAKKGQQPPDLRYFKQTQNEGESATSVWSTPSIMSEREWAPALPTSAAWTRRRPCCTAYSNGRCWGLGCSPDIPLGGVFACRASNADKKTVGKSTPNDAESLPPVGRHLETFPHGGR